MISMEPSVSAQALVLMAWVHIWCLAYPPTSDLTRMCRCTLHKTVLLMNALSMEIHNTLPA